ncbi:Virus X resistance protein-like, coiled-coil domain [Sesbania bispinosa]|nr:Virus X resistance protein-like, coiled-coil domain [Sesbania bispinosa]
MAEQIPYGVASSILVRLASAAFRELGRIYGVRDELESLKNTVESIQAVLLDAEEKQEQRDRAVQVWIRRLKDVLYPAEDLLDEFAIEDMRHTHKNKVKKEIIGLLRQPHENQNVSVHAIVGIGGLGKTALAQLVYNDVEVQMQNFFQKRMWVCVSYDFYVKTILKNMLESLMGEKVDDKLSLDNLQKKLHENLDGKRYLTLGGVLQSKSSEESEWTRVLQGDFWKLCEEEDSIMPVLKLSYQDLSPRERQCFAYCSLYPKDYEIEKDELIQMWMAHGYLESSIEGKLMEDVGNQLVKTFFMKSLFQDAEITPYGDIFSFKMHDLIHDLAKLVAGNDCCYLDGEAKGVVGTPMHVFLEHNAIHLLGSLDASRLRTLILLFDSVEEGMSGMTEDELSIISKFKYLRVLKVSDSSVGKLFALIGKLIHLRYLHLIFDQHLAAVPESISNLVCLQKLKLERSMTPDEFISLRCSGEELEVSTKVVSKLINLRHLHISRLGIMRAQQVQYKSVTKWLSSLTHIVEISLERCYGLRYLPPMECLPSLKSISIFQLDELEYIYYEEGKTLFPSLEILTIMHCEKLRGWCRMGDDTNSSSHHLSELPPFPRLSQLQIYGCRELTCVPPFPKLDDSLELCECSVEPLEATLNIAAVNDFTPLSMLKSLEIKFEILGMEKLPKDWMQNLTSLEVLEFRFLPSEILFQEIEAWFKDDVDFLPSLKKMGFIYCDDLHALPEGIARFTNLRTPHIYGHGTPFLDKKRRGKKQVKKIRPKIASIFEKVAQQEKQRCWR